MPLLTAQIGVQGWLGNMAARSEPCRREETWLELEEAVPIMDRSWGGETKLRKNTKHATRKLENTNKK